MGFDSKGQLGPKLWKFSCLHEIQVVLKTKHQPLIFFLPVMPFSWKIKIQSPILTYQYILPGMGNLSRTNISIEVRKTLVI